MAALSDFYPMLLVQLPGCASPMVAASLIEVAREFCRMTSAWRVDFDAITLTAGQATYDLDSPEGESEVLRITQLAAGGMMLWTEEENEQRRTTADYPKYTRDNPPFALGNDLKTITLIADEVPAASLASGLVVSGALQPTRSATALPQFLLDVYGDAMRAGTLARLMVMGNQTWTDRQLAVEYRREYDQMAQFAAYQGAVGNTRKPLRVKSWG